MAARNVTRGTVIADRVEVAGGLWAKFLGLMGRASLAPGAALWLPDENGIHMLFMRFPIDAIFVGRPAAGQGDARPVVAVRRRLRPWTGVVPFVRGGHGCLELPAGAIDASGTALGDLVTIE